MRAAVVLLLALGCSADPPPVAVPTTVPPPVVTTTVVTTPPVTETPSPRPTRTGYAFPVPRCEVTYARVHHDYPATDILAAVGCPYVSPVAGRVDEVSYADRWDPATNRGADRGGLYVSVVGVDGVRYYGSHLSAVAAGIRPGIRVRAGTRLGAVGTTGSARGTAPHLHFGISWPTHPGDWAVRRGMVYPWPYLDSWRAGGDRSPAAEVRAARDAAG